jgi:CMP-N,N'-diacetyllegionaminic acid synthase
MYCGKKILAIIPARGGSKGIPLKNLTKFKKKNLIENVKICLDNLKIKIDRVILSSDHNCILEFYYIYRHAVINKHQLEGISSSPRY